VAVGAGLLVLVRPRTSNWVAALAVAASALAVVLLYRAWVCSPTAKRPGMQPLPPVAAIAKKRG
jgi:hypothetical protein